MEEKTINRTLPYSIEAEQSVIGSMIQDNDAITVATEILGPDDFYQKQYGILFDAMQQMHNEGQVVDPITLQNKLNSMSVPPEVAKLDYLADIITMVPTTVRIKEYANIVKDKSILRQIIRVNENIENDCYKAQDSVDTILEKTEQEIFSLIKNRGASDFVPISKVALDALNRINAASKTKGNITGISTGFRDIDYMTAGLQKSDLILIAARPSMGKTAFVLNIAQNIIFKEEKCAAIFSLEMSREQLFNRLMSMESRIEAQKIRTGDLTADEWEGIAHATSKIGNSKLIIDDTPAISIAELKSKCRKYKLEYDLSIVIIDYLQLMTGSGKAESHQLEIAEISKSLKALARELDVPVVALSQLSRAVEARPDKRPILSDLRDSGAIEQDADVVMFIYRDDYYNPDSDLKGVSEIRIQKQRNGPVGSVKLAWLGEYTKFADYDESREHEKRAAE